MGPKPADIKAAENGLWKLCLALGSGSELQPLLTAYLEEHSGPPIYCPALASESWFVNGLPMEKAIHGESIEANPPESSRSTPLAGRAPRIATHPVEDSDLGPEDEGEQEDELQEEEGGTGKGKKRPREDSPPQPPAEGRPGRNTKKPGQAGKVGVPAGKRTKTGRKRKAKAKPMAYERAATLKLENVFQLYTSFVRPFFVLFVKMKANDVIRKSQVTIPR